MVRKEQKHKVPHGEYCAAVMFLFRDKSKSLLGFCLARNPRRKPFRFAIQE